MKERPILFNAEMVREILDGRKAQTRRIVKPQPDNGVLIHGTELVASKIPDRSLVEHGKQEWGLYAVGNDVMPCFAYNCPYGKPGDRLWIKTGYSTRYLSERNETVWSTGFGFLTTHGKAVSKSGRVKKDGGHPGMFMPYWLSQELFPSLEITDVRVERLNEISVSDSIAEGIHPSGIGIVHPRSTAIDEFRSLWQSINGPDSWAANPWVWVISFKKAEVAA